MNLEKILAEYGLKEKEARVYIASLQVGSGPVLKVSQKAGLARSTTEVILKSLKSKGLVSSYKRKNINWYTAEDPRKIVSSLKSKADYMEKSLPKLLAIYGDSTLRPTVRFYEGMPGIEMVLGQIIEEATELLSFGSPEDIFQAIESFPIFVRKRMKARIPIKVILPDSEKARERQLLGPSELREVRIIDSKYSNHGLFYVWKNKVAMFSLKKEINVVLIESEELSRLQKSAFMALWDGISTL